MTNYNFDEIIDRSHTDALKIDAMKLRWHRDDLLPMWVADMDFRTPPFIMDALSDRCKHPILGYTIRPDAWYDAICKWLKLRHNLDVKRENVGFIPGVVNGIGQVIKCFTKPGDKVLIQPPVYHPFRLLTEANGREVVNSQLENRDERLYINFDKFEHDIKGCKLLVLSNPHNPGGRVWSLDELRQVADICIKNHVLVVSDEIHCDLTFPEFKHVPFASVSEEAAQSCITFMAPSKTFNCAGLGSSQYIIFNKDIYKRFTDYLDGSEMNMGHIFAYIPVIKGFSEAGAEWLAQLLRYIKKNVEYTHNFLHENMPLVDMMVPEASYLIFMDFRKLGLPQDELVRFIEDDAHLLFNDGTMFGPGGEGFMRINVGTPKAILEKGLNQLKDAYIKRFGKI